MTEPTTELLEQWRRLRPAPRFALGVLAVLVVGRVAWSVLVAMTGTGPSAPSAPLSSSYSAAPDGMGAFADLLDRHGHAVRRLRKPLAQAGLDAGATLVLMDPDAVDAADLRALRSFVAGGGHLVAGGGGVAAALRDVVDPSIAWSVRGGDTLQRWAPVIEIRAVDTVRSGGHGSWESTGPALGILGSDDRAVVAIADVGRGRVVMVADPSIFHNRFLGSADNAAFALAVVGDASAVAFDEIAHGYGSGRGLAALPRRWKWALCFAGFAVLAAMWSAGRRLGPPQDDARLLPPPRRAYVDALAATLAKTRQPGEAIAPLRRAARDRLSAATGISHGAELAEVRATAKAFGLSEAEVAAMLNARSEDEDLMNVGRAMARLERR